MAEPSSGRLLQDSGQDDGIGLGWNVGSDRNVDVF